MHCPELFPIDFPPIFSQLSFLSCFEMCVNHVGKKKLRCVQTNEAETREKQPHKLLKSNFFSNKTGTSENIKLGKILPVLKKYLKKVFNAGLLPCALSKQVCMAPLTPLSCGPVCSQRISSAPVLFREPNIRRETWETFLFISSTKSLDFLQHSCNLRKSLYFSK